MTKDEEKFLVGVSKKETNFTDYEKKGLNLHICHKTTNSLNSFHFKAATKFK
jgi:hypothetical protein